MTPDDLFKSVTRPGITMTEMYRSLSFQLGGEATYKDQSKEFKQKQHAMIYFELTSRLLQGVNNSPAIAKEANALLDNLVAAYERRDLVSFMAIGKEFEACFERLPQDAKEACYDPRGPDQES